MSVFFSSGKIEWFCLRRDEAIEVAGSPRRLLVPSNFVAAGYGIQRNAFPRIQITHSPQNISFSVLLKCIMHLEDNFAAVFCCCNVEKGANYVKHLL
jgi:hypothetical protein